MMRVLMFAWEYPPHIVGGLGAHVAALVPALARAGVEVHLVTPRWAGGERVEAMVEPFPNSAGAAIVYRVDPPAVGLGNYYADAVQTNLALEEEGHALLERLGGFHLIHAHDWQVAISAAALKHRHKLPLIATIHATERGRGRGHLGDAMSQSIDGMEWQLTYEAWRVICTSRFMLDEVRSYFQLPADKIDIVPNGVEAMPIDARQGVDLDDFRARWARPDERLVFFVGRLVPEKGAHVLVEAAPRILAQMPETKIILAGTGGMRDYLQRRAWELGVADKVILAGFIPDADRNCLYRVADAAAFPSLYEPFGIVALEAMAAQCPVVVSDVGGLGEVVRHTVTGVTVYPDNVESLAWGILHTLADSEQAKARAAKAYRTVVDEYSWDRIAERTARTYARVADERAKTNW